MLYSSSLRLVSLYIWPWLDGYVYWMAKSKGRSLCHYSYSSVEQCVPLSCVRVEPRVRHRYLLAVSVTEALLLAAPAIDPIPMAREWQDPCGRSSGVT